MITLEGAKKAMVNAHKAGDFESARKMAAIVKREQERRASLPGYNAEGAQSVDPDVPGYVSPETDVIPWLKPPEPQKGVIETLGSAAVGTAEAAATMATGATTGLAAGLGSMFTDIAKNLIQGGPQQLDDYMRSSQPEQAFMRGMSAGTYEPRSETGQEIVQTVGEIAPNLPPVIAPGLSNINLASRAAGNVPMVARSKIEPPLNRLRENVRQEVDASRSARLAQEGSQPASQGGITSLFRPRQQSETQGSVGAAELELARLRQAKANELDIPIRLSVGEATGDQGAIRFEKESQKLPQGERIREAQREKNRQIAQNLDLWTDQTGAELVSVGDKGQFIDEAFSRIMAQKNQRIDQAYQRARQEGELSEPVELNRLTNYLNDPIVRSEAINDGILKTTRRALLETGAAIEVDDVGPNGQPIKVLIPDRINLAQGEEIRKLIGNAVSIEKSDRRQARLLKEAYDEDTENVSGNYFQRARKMRRKFAEEFENNELVRKLTQNNPISGEKLVAVESIVDTILSPSSSLASRDRLVKLRRILIKGPKGRRDFNSSQGRQAWREVQGALIDKIKEQTFRTTNFDDIERNPIPSYAGMSRIISQMDKGGKLEVVLGKKGAEQMRTLNEIVKYIYTAPPGTINHSNTATVLYALLDGLLIGTGVPAPFASAFNIAKNKIKDQRLLKKIDQHLQGVEP